MIPPREFHTCFTYRLRTARRAVGLTQYQLSKKTGIHDSLPGKYERGDTTPTAYNLAKLAKALGVSADWLLGLQDTPLRRV